jgi:hypothetical protein
MSAKHVSKQEMASRVARFDKLEASPQAFLDTRIPGHERDIFNVIGPGVTEDPKLRPAITDARDFNVTYVGADPGKGAALCTAIRRSRCSSRCRASGRSTGATTARTRSC